MRDERVAILAHTSCEYIVSRFQTIDHAEASSTLCRVPGNRSHRNCNWPLYKNILVARSCIGKVGVAL